MLALAFHYRPCAVSCVLSPFSQSCTPPFLSKTTPESVVPAFQQLHCLQHDVCVEQWLGLACHCQPWTWMSCTWCLQGLRQMQETQWKRWLSWSRSACLYGEISLRGNKPAIPGGNHHNHMLLFNGLDCRLLNWCNIRGSLNWSVQQGVGVRGSTSIASLLSHLTFLISSHFNHNDRSDKS